MQNDADSVALQHIDQPSDVVLVGMRQEQDVDASREVRPRGPQAAKRELRVNAAVHQDRAAHGGLDQDRVALPDVERGEMQAAVRQLRERDRGEYRDECRRGPARPRHAP